MDVDLFFTNEYREQVRLGSDPYHDVVEAVLFYESIGLRAWRLDADDWVTLAEIGMRIGRSREIVRMWSSGRYGPRDFPPPLNPGRDTTFYSWAEVSHWLRHNRPQDGGDPEEPLLVAFNLATQLRRWLPRVSRPAAVLSLLSTPPSTERAPEPAVRSTTRRRRPYIATDPFSC